MGEPTSKSSFAVQMLLLHRICVGGIEEILVVLFHQLYTQFRSATPFPTKESKDKLPFPSRATEQFARIS